MLRHSSVPAHGERQGRHPAWHVLGLTVPLQSCIPSLLQSPRPNCSVLATGSPHSPISPTQLLSAGHLSHRGGLK